MQNARLGKGQLPMWCWPGASARTLYGTCRALRSSNRVDDATVCDERCANFSIRSASEGDLCDSSAVMRGSASSPGLASSPSLARLKVSQIIASLSESEASLQADQKHEQEMDQLLLTRQQAAETSARRVAGRVAAAKAQLDASAKARAASASRARASFRRLLIDSEAASARALRQQAETALDLERRLREGMAAKVTARLERERQLAEKGSGAVTGLEARYRDAAARTERQRRSRHQLLRAQVEAYETRRQGVLSQLEARERRRAEAVSDLIRRHAARAAHAEACLASAAEATSARARAATEQHELILRRGQSRSQESLRQRQEAAMLSLSRSEGRLRSDREHQQRALAAAAANKEAMTRKNLERVRQQQLSKDTLARAHLREVRDKCVEIEEQRRMREAAVRAQARKANTTMARVLEVESKQGQPHIRPGEVRALLSAVQLA